MEERQQAAAEGYAQKEGQLRTALDRLQVLAQQAQSKGGRAARGAPDGRLQAAQARCDRAEARHTNQQAKTQQVMAASSNLYRQGYVIKAIPRLYCQGYIIAVMYICIPEAFQQATK